MNNDNFKTKIIHFRALTVIVLFGGSVHEGRLGFVFQKPVSELVKAGFVEAKTCNQSAGMVTTYTINKYGIELVENFGERVLENALKELK